jgi:hypothetical protein
LHSRPTPNCQTGCENAHKKNLGFHFGNEFRWR